MSNLVEALELEQAEELARRLAAAVSARRIYAPDHNRVQTALREFLDPLHAVRAADGRGRLRLTVTGGTLTHEGVPLEGPGTQLAPLLAEKQCGGMVIRPGMTHDTATALIDWLGGRRPPGLRPQSDSLELLDPGAGEELQDDADRKGHLLEDFPEFQVPKQVLESALEVVSHLMADVRAGRGPDFRELADLTSFACEAVRSEGTKLLAATQLPREDPKAFDHAINVFLIATTMLEPFAKDDKDLSIFSQAALLHDVGTGWLPEDLLLRDELTEEELIHFRKHPEYGAKILAQMTHVDPLAVEVAYCHHMRDDGRGFPTPIMAIKPGPVTNMVQLGDLYERVAERRRPGENLGAQQVVNCILEQPGLKSRAAAIAHFVQRLTDAPPGAEVELETGQRAIVVETFADAPSKPLVRVIREAGGLPVLEPYVLDLREAAPDQGGIVHVRLKPEENA